jgi:hypothetical protein
MWAKAAAVGNAGRAAARCLRWQPMRRVDRCISSAWTTLSPAKGDAVVVRCDAARGALGEVRAWRFD